MEFWEAKTDEKTEVIRITEQECLLRKDKAVQGTPISNIIKYKPFVLILHVDALRIMSNFVNSRCTFKELTDQALEIRTLRDIKRSFQWLIDAKSWREAAGAYLYATIQVVLYEWINVFKVCILLLLYPPLTFIF